MPHSYPLLFSPRALGAKQAPNRIVSTSHGTNMAANGVPTPQLIAYHAEKARGGCGTVMMFGSAAVSPLLPVPNNHVNLWREDVEPGLRDAAAAVHAHGALALSQITAIGRRTHTHLDYIGRGPSASSAQLAQGIPHVLSLDEIRTIVDDYARAAAKLKACGFDGCDLAFYDDQLPDQFWTPSMNMRTDAYGGSLENRMRFSLEVVEAVRGAVGSDFIVGARVSADDFMPNGLDAEDLIEIITRLDDTRKLDYFTITAGTISTFRSRGYNIPSAYYPERAFVPLAARIKSRIGHAAVIVTGRIVTPAQAEDVLRSGAADFVGMTRALMADPDLPRKAREGRSEDIRVCMGSSEGCIDRLYFGLPIGCVQNPVMGREREWGALQRAGQPKRVLVAGGGPAGMEAARVAAERGHAVTLIERAAQLGGAIRIAARAPGWEAYSQSVDWLARELGKLRVDVQLNTTATAESIAAFAPDAVVIACGAVPRKPNLPGVDLPHVRTCAEVLGNFEQLRASIGPRCVILDETGYTPGPKVADLLSGHGIAVEIVTRQYSLGEDVGTTLRAKLIERLLRNGVQITPLAEPAEITPAGVTLRHMLMPDRTWHVPAATVIVSSSGIAQDGLFGALKAQHPRMQVHLIGDAFAPRNLRAAMVDGARVGREI